MNLTAAAKALEAAPLSEYEEAAIRLQDARLLADLYQKNANYTRYYSQNTGLYFFNSTVGGYARTHYDQQSLAQLEDLLLEKGVTSIPVIDGFQVVLDGHERAMSIVAATDISVEKYHGEMSSMLYLRDHIQTAAAYMELYLADSTRYKKEGEEARKLLISALDLLSTPAQLQRFKGVILQRGGADQEAWPHISLWFDDLQGEHSNGWRNMQDSFQMLAYHVLDALERGFLKDSDLIDSHRTFLGAIVPLLDAVGFPHYESSGSWEEVAARRTSVIAIETALLYKYHTLKGFDFLPDQALTETLFRKGLNELANRLPYESADYSTDEIRYRKADAALIYVLLYDLPILIEKFADPIAGKTALSTEEIEVLLLKQLATLEAPVTGGMRRYNGDSYQRVNFHTEAVQWVVRAIKQKVQDDAQRAHCSADYALKQQLRAEWTPREYEAAWTHPMGQLAAWAAKKSLQQDAPAYYRVYAEQFFNKTLTLITGEQWYIVREEEGYVVRQVPAFALPECYIAYRDGIREPLFVPSPHTPLHWSGVMLRLAVGLLRHSTKQ